jgi:D-alanyl-D-alanine carboxypeptidase
MKREEVKTKLEKKLSEIVKSDSQLYNAYLLIHSEKHDIHWNMAAGQSGDFTACADQPYHTASIAKTFTSVLIAMLEEEGKLNYHDRITKYLPEELMKELHVYKGKDYSRDITIEHLVGCTSGLPDFYEDKPKNDKPFLDLLLDEPSRYWTPQETIHWTKHNMSPKFQPSKKVHYTNTGYNLLGLVIENILSKPYHEVLHDYLFQPLGMNHTYLSQYSQPKEHNHFPTADINIKNKRVIVEDHHSFSSIYAGGQTVSTSEDLLIFMKALIGNKLIAKESLIRMMNWNKLWMGVDYGYGLMRIKMMPLTEKYNVWGHLGSIGSFMLYNPSMDVYVIGNFNRSGYTAKSIRYVFNTLRAINSIKEQPTSVVV